MENGHAYLDECIHLAGEYKEYRILAFAISMKAQAMGTNVTQEVLDLLEDVIAFSRKRKDKYELFLAVFSAGQAYIQIGQPQKGKTYLDEVTEMVEKYEIPFFSSWVYYPQALLAKYDGDLNKAEKYFKITIDSLSKFRGRRMVATAQSELAHLYRQQGRLDEAEAIYRQTILSWQEQGHLSAVAHQLECFAFLMLAQNQYKTAARLLGAAHQARKQLNAISTEAQEIAELGQAMQSLANVMGEPIRDQELAEGARMSLDAAVNLALEATNTDTTMSKPNADGKMHLDSSPHQFDLIPSSNHK
jgi:ATP/maltotriose-dependent transcriptional regulator MalT